MTVVVSADAGSSAILLWDDSFGVSVSIGFTVVVSAVFELVSSEAGAVGSGISEFSFSEGFESDSGVVSVSGVSGVSVFGVSGISVFGVSGVSVFGVSVVSVFGVSGVSVFGVSVVSVFGVSVSSVFMVSVVSVSSVSVVSVFEGFSLKEWQTAVS